MLNFPRADLRRVAVRCFICVLCISVNHALVAQALPHAVAEQVGMSSSRLALLDTVLRQHVQDGHVAGLVAGVVRHGKIVYLESMGWQDIEQAAAMRDDSLFQIRSMTKPITSLAVMQLIEAGQLRLDDPVSRYIPSFASVKVFVSPEDPDHSALRAPSRAITIEDLLLNVGGISHRFGTLYRSRGVRSRGDTLEQLVAKVAAVPLMGDPGTAWIYSESATVLGHVVEIISGQTFDAYLQQHVFAPLNMPDTDFFVPAAKLDRLARPYQAPSGERGLVRSPQMEVPITIRPALLEGSAGLVSTVPDYLRFLQSFLNGGELEGQRVLSPSLVKEMTRNHIEAALLPIGLSPSNPMFDLGWGYGFTVVIDPSKSDYAVNMGEFGWNGSLGTFSWADPVSDTVAVLMLQIEPSSAYSLSAQFKALVAQALITQ
jgi:CubicO group peptidase (beta-lactamase class C family)